MPAPLLLDLSHTSHTRARTGIQRVARALQTALGQDAVAITHDPHLGAWRPLEAWEQANLSAQFTGGKRGARWPLRATLRGKAGRLFGRGPVVEARLLATNASGVLMPEVFSPAVAAAFPAIFAATRGPRVAVFHDAIPLKHPELTPPKTVARFPHYLRELLAFDGIAANSEDSRATLVEYWRQLSVSHPPPVQAIPLGVDEKERTVHDAQPGPNGPVVLSVGSIEGRKNHLALLGACEQLWTRGLQFELRLVGHAQLETGREALARLRALQAAGRPLRYDGPLDDAAVDAAYATCAFTVYPSISEGFGLPVIESLAHGKPCICSAAGALGESARGGGCIALDSVDAASLANAIARLLIEPATVATLATAARARMFRSWHGYASELTAWMKTLRRRD